MDESFLDRWIHSLKRLLMTPTQITSQTNPVKTVEVTLERPYTVTVGRGLLEQLEIPHSRRVLIYDSGLPEELVARVSNKAELVIPLPSGEACKTLEVHAFALSELAKLNFPRDCALISLGGGATSDLAGYVAASYLRGVDFYNIPTTLLGMVDASVGGKTGVNLPEGKNLVGAFWQPRAVFLDLDTLSSLPEDVFKEGMAEMFKHGLIDAGAAIPKFYEKSDVSSPEFLEMLARSVAVKAGIVSRDPLEQGERAFLNLGHTLGHALESRSKKPDAVSLSHGEAIAYGLHYAALLSHLEGNPDFSAQTLAFLQWMRPKPLPTQDFAELLEYMARDKKALSSGLRFTLLRQLGECYVSKVSLERQTQAFDLFLESVKL
jgi:3-dehydroquinate synthase